MHIPFGKSFVNLGKLRIMSPTLLAFGEKLRELNPDLFVRETSHPYVDKVTLKGKDMCSIPKGGKLEKATWEDYAAYTAEDKTPQNRIRHRSLSQLLDDLTTVRIITPEQRKRWIGR